MTCRQENHRKRISARSHWFYFSAVQSKFPKGTIILADDKSRGRPVVYLVGHLIGKKFDGPYLVAIVIKISCLKFREICLFYSNAVFLTGEQAVRKIFMGHQAIGQ